MTRRGRAAALVLGAAVLAGCGISGVGVGPATTRTGSSPLTGPVSAVRIDLPAGDVTVRVAPGAAATVRRTATTAGVGAPGATYRLDGADLRLEGCAEQSCDIDYEVELPAPVAVTGRVGSGDVLLDGTGPVDLGSGSGDVRVQAPTGPVAVAGGAGGVSVALAAPVDVTVTTTSGDVAVTATGGPYRVAVASGGDAEVAVPDGPAAVARLDLRTASGDVRVAPGA